MLNLFHRNRDHRRQSEAVHNQDGIRLLALTRDAEEWHALQEIAGAEDWLLLWAHTSALATEIIGRCRVPIVICDKDLPNEDWRIVVAGLAALYPPVCVLLASEVSDGYLWREMAQQGGFEILTKPFDREKVIRTVRFAWSWRGWAQQRMAKA